MWARGSLHGSAGWTAWRDQNALCRQRKILCHQQGQTVWKDDNTQGIGEVSERSLYCDWYGLSANERCELCKWTDVLC